MSEIDVAAIRATVRAVAAKKLVDRRTAADLLFQTKILSPDPRLQNMEMFTEPPKPFIGALFRGDFDYRVSSKLRKLFPGHMKHITDQLEASWQTERYATQGNQMVTTTRSSIQDPPKEKKTMVEECFVLDMEQLEKWGMLSPNAREFKTNKTRQNSIIGVDLLYI